MNVVESFSVIQSNEENKYKYEYRMIKNDVVLSYGREKIVVQSYGIEAERQDLINGNIVNIEREIIRSISPNRYKVHNLIKMLIEHVVSPIHIVDVVGEYVDEYVIDFDEAYKNISIS